MEKKKLRAILIPKDLWGFVYVFKIKLFVYVFKSNFFGVPKHKKWWLSVNDPDLWFQQKKWELLISFCVIHSDCECLEKQPYLSKEAIKATGVVIVLMQSTVTLSDFSAILMVNISGRFVWTEPELFLCGSAKLWPSFFACKVKQLCAKQDHQRFWLLIQIWRSKYLTACSTADICCCCSMSVK